MIATAFLLSMETKEKIILLMDRVLYPLSWIAIILFHVVIVMIALAILIKVYEIIHKIWFNIYVKIWCWREEKNNPTI